MRAACAYLILAAAMTAAPGRNVERELREAENAWAQAAITGDAATLRRMLAEDLSYTHSSGRTETKAQFIESITSGQMKYEAAELEEFSVKPYGNVAVALSVRRMRAGLKGDINSFRARFQRVWVKRDGRWQLLAHQATRLAN